jgi:hypothetical protein
MSRGTCGLHLREKADELGDGVGGEVLVECREGGFEAKRAGEDAGEERRYSVTLCENV